MILFRLILVVEFPSRQGNVVAHELARADGNMTNHQVLEFFFFFFLKEVLELMPNCIAISINNDGLSLLLKKKMELIYISLNIVLLLLKWYIRRN